MSRDKENDKQRKDHQDKDDDRGKRKGPEPDKVEEKRLQDDIAKRWREQQDKGR